MTQSKRLGHLLRTSTSYQTDRRFVSPLDRRTETVLINDNFASLVNNKEDVFSFRKIFFAIGYQQIRHCDYPASVLHSMQFDHLSRRPRNRTAKDDLYREQPELAS